MTEGTEAMETDPGIDVVVEYYALFKSCARKGEETLRLEDPAPGTLYDALRSKYRFPLEKHLVHLAVNDSYSPWDRPLRQGDRVVFIPPVSGG